MTMPASAEVDVQVALCAAIQSNTAALQASERRKRQLAGSVAYLSAPAAAFQSSQMPYPVMQGPRAGWSWAVQRVVVAGLGTSDILTAYKGRAAADAVASNALFTFTVAAAGAVATWHPGRTGLVLLGRENGSLVFNGTLAGTATVSWDVIQIADEQLPYFLL